MPVKITCSSCENSLELEGSERDWSGQTVVCHKCSHDIIIPKTDPSIDTTCPSCSTVLELAPPVHQWIGKTLICPSCSKPFKFTAAAKLCPECGESMEPETLLCVSCGLDLRTGKKATLSADPRQGLQVKSDEPMTTCRFCESEMYADAPVCPSCHRYQSDGEGDNTRFLPKGVQRWDSDSYRQQIAGPESPFQRGVERFKDIMFGFIEGLGKATRIAAGVAVVGALCYLVFKAPDYIKKLKAPPKSPPTETESQPSPAVEPEPSTDNKDGISSAEVKTLMEHAGKGDAKAQYKIGVCYECGKGEPKDPVQAVTWFRKAAGQGFAPAQYRLGLCCYNGNGVGKDLTEAVTWLRKAADQGNADAQGQLGLCYYNGEGVPKDLTEAITWLRKAAEQGNVDAQSRVGRCYYLGEGVQKNSKEAVIWLQKAAQQESADAQCDLGRCYYLGDGIAKNWAEAITLYRKAAEQGHALAQYRLGACYVDGSGVERNIAEAVQWYKLSAAQGCDLAQLKLGLCYYRGAGVAQDKLEARRLFKLAKEQGNKDGEKLLKEIDSELNKPQ
jgi:TPR repeat protein